MVWLGSNKLSKITIDEVKKSNLTLRKQTVFDTIMITQYIISSIHCLQKKDWISRCIYYNFLTWHLQWRTTTFDLHLAALSISFSLYPKTPILLILRRSLRVLYKYILFLEDRVLDYISCYHFKIIFLSKTA